MSSSIFGVGLMSPMINNSPFVSDCCNSVSIVGDSCWCLRKSVIVSSRFFVPVRVSGAFCHVMFGDIGPWSARNKDDVWWGTYGSRFDQNLPPEHQHFNRWSVGYMAAWPTLHQFVDISGTNFLKPGLFYMRNAQNCHKFGEVTLL